MKRPLRGTPSTFLKEALSVDVNPVYLGNLGRGKSQAVSILTLFGVITTDKDLLCFTPITIYPVATRFYNTGYSWRDIAVRQECRLNSPPPVDIVC